MVLAFIQHQAAKNPRPAPAVSDQSCLCARTRHRGSASIQNNPQGQQTENAQGYQALTKKNPVPARKIIAT